MKLLSILILTSIILSCNSETKVSNSLHENRFLAESKYAPSQFETDETLKNFIPAKKNEIDLVRTAEDEYVIEYGYSFGECYGFCKSKIEFTSEGLLNTKSRWSDNKEIIEYYRIYDSTYNVLIDSIKYKELIDFDEYLGCGDCADAGAEWIQIKKGEQIKKIGGTYGFDVECINSLLYYLRNLDKTE